MVRLENFLLKKKIMKKENICFIIIYIIILALIFLKHRQGGKVKNKLIYFMKAKREFEKTDLFEALQKKVKLCDDSRSTTIINENSNSMDSLINYSKAASKVLNKPSLRERFEQMQTLESIRESKYYGLIEILYLIDS